MTIMSYIALDHSYRIFLRGPPQFPYTSPPNLTEVRSSHSSRKQARRRGVSAFDTRYETPLHDVPKHLLSGNEDKALEDC